MPRLVNKRKMSIKRRTG